MELETILSIAPYIVMVLIGAGGSYYVIFKGKLGKLRKAIDTVDDALKDDAVNNEEFVKIFEDFKELAKK